MRYCCLLEFHFRMVGRVLQMVSLEEDRLVRHIHKYKFNMWYDQIHIPYLILWIRPVFNQGCLVFICNIFHDVWAISLLALPSKWDFLRWYRYCRRADWKTWVHACLVAPSFWSNLNLICWKKNVSLIRRKLESMGQSKTILLIAMNNITHG